MVTVKEIESIIEQGLKNPAVFNDGHWISIKVHKADDMAYTAERYKSFTKAAFRLRCAAYCKIEAAFGLISLGNYTLAKNQFALAEDYSRRAGEENLADHIGGLFTTAIPTLQTEFSLNLLKSIDQKINVIERHRLTDSERLEAILQLREDVYEGMDVPESFSGYLLKTADRLDQQGREISSAFCLTLDAFLMSGRQRAERLGDAYDAIVRSVEEIMHDYESLVPEELSHIDSLRSKIKKAQIDELKEYVRNNLAIDAENMSKSIRTRDYEPVFMAGIMKETRGTYASAITLYHIALKNVQQGSPEEQEITARRDSLLAEIHPVRRPAYEDTDSRKQRSRDENSVLLARADFTEYDVLSVVLELLPEHDEYGQSLVIQERMKHAEFNRDNVSFTRHVLADKFRPYEVRIKPSKDHPGQKFFDFAEDLAA